MRTRTKPIYVYLSETEKTQLEKQVINSGLTVSEYIRKLIMGIEVRPRPPDDFYKLLREINAIGVNINQIAHIANAEREIQNDRIEYAVRLVDEIMEKVRDLE